MTPNRPLDQQPVLLDEEASNDIDRLLEDEAPDWHRLELRTVWSVREGVHDTARHYVGYSFDSEPRLASVDDGERMALPTLEAAIVLRNRVVRSADRIGVKVSPVIQSRHIAVIATEYVTER